MAGDRQSDTNESCIIVYSLLFEDSLTVNLVRFIASLIFINKKAVPEMDLPFILKIHHKKSYGQKDYPDGSEYQVYPFDPIRSSLGFVT